MPEFMTVKGLIEHLKKYPGHLNVMIYRPPFKTGYRVIGPRHPTKGNQWLYNTRSVYIPIEETRQQHLPDNYKAPPKKKPPGRPKRKRKGDKKQ